MELANQLMAVEGALRDNTNASKPLRAEKKRVYDQLLKHMISSEIKEITTDFGAVQLVVSKSKPTINREMARIKIKEYLETKQPVDYRQLSDHLFADIEIKDTIKLKVKRHD